MIFNINRKSSGYWSEIFLRLIDVQSRGECYLRWWPYYSHTLPSLLISPFSPLEVLLYPLEISLKVPLMGSPPLYWGWSFSRHFNLCNDCMIVRFQNGNNGINKSCWIACHTLWVLIQWSVWEHHRILINYLLQHLLLQSVEMCSTHKSKEGVLMDVSKLDILWLKFCSSF